MEEEESIPVASQWRVVVGDVVFYMRLAPATSFPTGTSNLGVGRVKNKYWIGETQVTYELWYKVMLYAKTKSYVFANVGAEGSHGETGNPPTEKKDEPVTKVSFRDSIVWCNALSEYIGYEPVYSYLGEVVKDATLSKACDRAKALEKDGFRLPTSIEWELAARYRGGDSSFRAIEHPQGSGCYWTPGDYASGATADFRDEEATKACAWYQENSDVDGKGHKTQPVGQKPAGGNGLGLYDMSGNVWEWCFDKRGVRRVKRGESWYFPAETLQVGVVSNFFPKGANINGGLRLVKNL